MTHAPSVKQIPCAWPLRLGLAALLLVGLALAPACGTRPADASADSSAEDDGGDLAPDFMLTDLQGTEFNLSDTTGQVRLIDFWATWCAPCREEIPMLVGLDQTYRDQGLKIVAISDESGDVLRDFVDGKGITYTNLIDDGDVAAEYFVLGLPTGFLIDREGNIVERFVGPKPTKILEKRIRELLDLPPA